MLFLADGKSSVKLANEAWGNLSEEQKELYQKKATETQALQFDDLDANEQITHINKLRKKMEKIVSTHLHILNSQDFPLNLTVSHCSVSFL